MSDSINHPPHYTKYPAGVHAECIEYTRVMGFSQGNAFKYVYRYGQKDAPLQELRKSEWYLTDCLTNGPVGAYAQYLATPRIDSDAGWAALTLHLIAKGSLSLARIMVRDEINRLANTR